MFEHFDFSALDDPSFKEDAVREEIVAPVLRRVGYRPSGEVRVERSKPLVHPFVMIGTKKHPVNIVPDYTLFLGPQALMVLEAKAPSEPIVESKHVEQAYSYAIHPEVRCDHYGLCNGRELAIYNVRQWEPTFRIGLRDVDRQWDEVCKALHPRYLQLPDLRDFMDDYGLRAMKAGIRGETDLIFVDYYLQDIIRVRDDLYTSSSCHEEDGREYCVSFDFNAQLLSDILKRVPEDFSQELHEQLGQQPFLADIDGKICLTCRGRLGELTTGAFEQFVPIELEEITEVSFFPNTQLKHRRQHR